MDEIIRIINLKTHEIDEYVNEKLTELNDDWEHEEISFYETGGNIIWNWISTNTVYLPPGNRSKGFKIDRIFLKQLLEDLKKHFGKIPIEMLKNKFNNNMLFKWLDMYIIMYFGSGYDEKLRKNIYGYGSLNYIGVTIKISELKNLNVARCIEKSSTLNLLLNFLGFNSSLVLSDANGIGHAYCMVNDNEKLIIIDPSFYGKGSDGKGIPYIFELDTNSKYCEFNPAHFGDNETLKVTYDFPYDKLTSNNKTIK